MGEYKPDITLDYKGMSCPEPLIEAKKVMLKLEEGAVMLLISKCTGARAWAKATGHRLLEERVGSEGSYYFYIKKV